MDPSKHLQKLLLLFIVGLAVSSPIAQSVSATPFFDGRVTLQSKANPPLRTFLGEALNLGNERINVLLVFSDIPTVEQVQTLRSIAVIETFTGHVATISLPRNSLERLASLDFVASISMPRATKPELDVSVQDILADQVWNTTKYPGVRDSFDNPVNGTGVIVGIIDTGIDYLHRDFFFKNGTSKILYIWDQTVDGSRPVQFDYGNECTPSDIRTKSCSEADSAGQFTGHGTAVAAIAASTGQASGKFFGVAPGASIIAVKLKSSADNYVLDAVNYIAKTARELGRPFVINCSDCSDSLGSHDGTEPLEIALTDFAADGIPVVVPSGNSRNLNIHVSGKLTPGQSVTVPWAISEGKTQSYIDLWYPVSDFLDIYVKTPSGNVISGPTSDAGISTPDGNVIILADKRLGREWWINITSTNGSPLQPIPWSYTLTGVTVVEGRWDAWTEPGNFTKSGGTITGAYAIDPSDTIDYPGTARGVITVGSYMTKYSWFARCTPCTEHQKKEHLIGYWWSPMAPAVGDLEYVSGAGPTRDGRMKPDITAPGASIAAARAYTAPSKFSDPDDYHQMWRGTSFAAPHVAGAIALMLQMNPYLSVNEIKDILKADARQDTFTGTIDSKIGSPLWGWGKVNALKSTQDAPTLYSVRVEVNSLGTGLEANLTLDGRTIQTVTLDSVKVETLEFRRGENHTLELTPIIQVADGIRYVVNGTPWTFSSGGRKFLQYRLQFFLQVVSAHGHPTGTGWYDVNSTAVASVASTNAEGYEFRGWAGSVRSTSATVEITMNSTKQLVAQWDASTGSVSPEMTNSMALVIVIVIAAASVAAAIVAFRRLRQRSSPKNYAVHQHPSES